MISEVMKFNYTFHGLPQVMDSTDPLHGLFAPSQCFRANDDKQTDKLHNSQEHSCALELDQLSCKTVSNSPWHAFSLCQLALSHRIHNHRFYLDVGCSHCSYSVLGTEQSYWHIHMPL